MKRINLYKFLFILTTILIFNINFVAFAKKKKKPTKSQKKTPIKRKKEELKKQKANKRNFDEIKEFYSYDPVTGKWSKIEDFETIEILENRKEKRKEEYIYRDFWAYDYKTKQWYKVDISAFGYKKPEETGWNRIFKNFAIDIGTGFGLGQHDMFAYGKNIFIADIGGQGVYKLCKKNGNPIGKNIGNLNIRRNYPIGFLQLADSIQEINDNIYNSNMNRSERVRFAQRIYGIEPVIPFFISAHYTFNKKYRIGMDLELSLNLLEEFNIKLQGKGKTEFLRRTVPGQIKKGMFYKSPLLIIKPSLCLGYSVYRWNTFNDIILDLQLGTSLYLTDAAKFRPIGFWNLRSMLGLRYERRFGNYGRLFTRVGPEFELGKIMEVGKRGDLFSRVIRFNIQVGIGTYFGKDQEVEKAVLKQLKEVRKRKLAKRKRLARAAKKKKIRNRYKRLGVKKKKKKRKK